MKNQNTVSRAKVFNRLTIALLVIVLAVSAVLIASHNTKVMNTQSPPVASSYHWRDNDNTRVERSQLDDIVSQILGESRSTESGDDNTEELYSLIVDSVSDLDEDMWKFVGEDNFIDFANYQFELFNNIGDEYTDMLRQELAEEPEALAFFDHYTVEENSDFMPSNDRSRLAAIAGVPGWAMATINGARVTTQVTMKIWFVPLWLKAAIVAAALIVTTAIIIAYWGHIRPVLGQLIQSFINVAGRIANTINDFFNNVRNQANNSYLQDAIRSLSQFISKAVAITSIINQLQQDMYYPAVVVGKELFVIPTPLLTQELAVATFSSLGSISTAQNTNFNLNGQTKFRAGGVFAKLDNNAREVAQRANYSGSPFKELDNSAGGYWHWHAFDRTPKGHAWYVW